MRPAFAVRFASRRYANAEADSASACTLTSPLLRTCLLLLRYPPSLFRTLYARSPPASTRSHRISCSPLVSPPPPATLLPLPFSVSFRPSGSRHPSATRPRTLAIKFYIYYITPFLLLAPLHVDLCNISPFLPLCSLSPSMPPDYVSARSVVLESHLRTTYVPRSVFLLRSLAPFALSSSVPEPSCPSCLFPVCRNLFSPSCIPPLLYPTAIYFCT